MPRRRDFVLLAFGSNMAGRWGGAQATIVTAIRRLEDLGLVATACSGFYRTRPVGVEAQPPFVNAVAAFTGWIPVRSLLNAVKRLERAAGRRTALSGGGARPLDIDILDAYGLVIGGAHPRRSAGTLTLPHPEILTRGFVLVPLAETAPDWRHPVERVTARDVLRAKPRLGRGVVRFADPPCPDLELAPRPPAGVNG